MSEPVCPRDRLGLSESGGRLRCDAGHTYPVRSGAPLLLLEEAVPTQGGYWALADAEWGIELADSVAEEGIHPYVRAALVGTCGNLYKGADPHEYPIPQLRLAAGRGRTFLEIGSNWGRWCIAAARLGYRPTGVDPSLGAVLVGAAVARQLGVDVRYVVADGRHLPFADGSFDVVFSYSVLQHFATDDAVATLAEATRVLAPGGTLLVQMPNAYGPLNLVRQLRRRFRAARDFEVRYWRPGSLRSAVPGLEVSLEADGFLTLNGQISDAHILRGRGRVVVIASERLRRLSCAVPPLVYAADSLLVRARKAPA